jgi:hypothetical protein
MSDEIHDETEIDDAVIDDDEDAEVEGHAMFAAKKGFGLNPGPLNPIVETQMDDWERGASPGAQSNEPVLDDDVDEDEEAEVEGHVMFAEKKGFSFKPDLIPPPCKNDVLDDWERPGYSGNANEPVLGDDV